MVMVFMLNKRIMQKEDFTRISCAAMGELLAQYNSGSGYIGLN